MPDMNDRLDSIDGNLVKLRDAITSETTERRRSTRWTIAAVAVTLLLVATVAFVGYRVNEGRLASRDKSRCNTRSGFIDIANASRAPVDLTLKAIRDYDARSAQLGTSRCSGLALCGDGSYSESIGRGACSHHKGVERILVR